MKNTSENLECKPRRLRYLSPSEVFCRLAAILPIHELLAEPEQSVDPSFLEKVP